MVCDGFGSMAGALGRMIVFLSMAYPPALTPRAIQVERLAKAMDADIILYCCGKRVEERREGRLTIRSLPLAPLERFIVRVCDRFFPALKSMPDEYVIWARRAAKAIMKDVKPGRHDRLVTFSQPHSGHIAGLLVKRKAGCFWVASFSDPFTDNPFFRYGHFWVNKQLEKKIVEQADRVLFTSQETLDLVMKKYPGNLHHKAMVLEHSYAPEHAVLRQKFAGHRNVRFTLRHLGNLYAERSPMPVIDALVKIQAKAPALLENFTLDFVGHVENKEEVLDRTKGLPEGVITFTGTVDYARSLELMHGADALLLIEAPGEQSVFLPSKLVDYIGAGKPILALTPPGTGARVAREAGGTVCDIRDPEKIYDALLSLLTNRALQPCSAAVRFSPRTIAENMVRLLNRGMV